MKPLKDQFLLDPGVIFLNHGSFGATPRPVFEEYQKWQRHLEEQPVYFVDNEMPKCFEDARQALGNYVNVDPDDLVYVPNATFGINVVARSLSLGPGDEVLTSNHEYGACDRTWRYMSQRRGFSYIQQPIQLPAESNEQIVDQFWKGVTHHTKVIFISHITSPTALLMPIEAICARASEASILTIIDGAHAPGQINLDVMALNADFYVGNGHKWLCGPKGSAFLYTKKECQSLIEPLIVGWGWGEDKSLTFGSNYLDYLQWWGTLDPAAYLAIPAAIQFQSDNDWPVVRKRCHEMVGQAMVQVCTLTGLIPLYRYQSTFYHQMATIPLPPIADLKAFKRRLYHDFHIEIPCIEWNDRQYIRLSVQGYNSQADLDVLLEALANLLQEI